MLACTGLACGGLADDGPEDSPGGASGLDSAPDDEAPSEAPGTPFPGRVSCADNPLLSGCSVAGHDRADPLPSGDAPSCEEQPLSPGCAEQVLAGLDLERLPPDQRATAVLGAYCGPCHAPGAAPPGADVPGPSDIRDLRRMMQEGYIADCSPERSSLLSAMRNNLLAVPEGYVAMVAAAIEQSCTPEQRQCANDPVSPGCAVVRAETVLDHRCGSCHGSAARAWSEANGVPLEGMGYIDDMKALLMNEKVRACYPGDSPVLIRGTDDGHPQPGLGFPLSLEDVNLLSDAIVGLCPGVASAGPEDAEQRRLEGLLEAQCGECHGAVAANRGTLQGALASVGSTDALVRGGWLTPCAADASLLMARLEDGSMPPPGATGPRPSSEDRAALRAFIDRPCSGP